MGNARGRNLDFSQRKIGSHSRVDEMCVSDGHPAAALEVCWGKSRLKLQDSEPDFVVTIFFFFSFS